MLVLRVNTGSAIVNKLIKTDLGLDEEEQHNLTRKAMENGSNKTRNRNCLVRHDY